MGMASAVFRAKLNENKTIYDLIKINTIYKINLSIYDGTFNDHSQNSYDTVEFKYENFSVKFDFVRFHSNCGMGIISNIVFTGEQENDEKILEELLKVVFSMNSRSVLEYINVDQTNKRLISYLEKYWKQYTQLEEDGIVYTFWEKNKYEFK